MLAIKLTKRLESMGIDYASTDRVLELAFGKLDRPSSRLDFPETGALSARLNQLLTEAESAGHGSVSLSHSESAMLASAGVEMWHRAIHSFLWSVALTERSPLWASVTGYYASHFAMRSAAHSMGIFKSFIHRSAIQVVVESGRFICQLPSSSLGEHAFYWKVVKDHPCFARSPLFRENHERNSRSDSSHRTYANYTDHVNAFPPFAPIPLDIVTRTVEKISRIRLYSVTEPSRDNFPDLQNVQILAFQRIVAIHDFFDEKVGGNRFWRAHRRPGWCKDVMIFQVEEQNVEEPLIS